MMDNTKFCNICFKIDILKNIFTDEENQISKVLFSFIPQNDEMQNRGVYLCCSCCSKLEDFHEFRKMCFANLINFPEQYFELKNNLEKHNDSDIKEKLKDFVNSKVCGQSYIPLVTLKEVEKLPKSIYNETYNLENDPAATEDGSKQVEFFFKNIKEELAENFDICKGVMDFESNNVDSNSTLYENGSYSSTDEELEGHNDYFKHGAGSKLNILRETLEATAVFAEKIFDKSAPVHTKDKLYKCDVCDKAFSKLRSLQAHKVIHNGDKPYKCALCDRAFTRLTGLAEDKSVQTDERPYKCDECDKSFRQKANLNRHKNTHITEKPYKCGKCGKAFSRSESFVSHKRGQNCKLPYMCHRCQKTFTTVSYLATHLHENPNCK